MSQALSTARVLAFPFFRQWRRFILKEGDEYSFYRPGRCLPPVKCLSVAYGEEARIRTAETQNGKS